MRQQYMVIHEAVNRTQEKDRERRRREGGEREEGGRMEGGRDRYQ